MKENIASIQKEASSVAQKTLKVQCPGCGAMNPETDNICQNCGKAFRTQECLACGNNIPMGSKICPKCGVNQAACSYM